MVTYYVGGHEAIYQPDGTSEIKRYIRDIAIHTIKSTGATTLHYVFNDHLGSGSVITDANGTIVETASFDAFGKRRDAKLWGGYANPFSHLPNLQALLNITQKGYTGHIQVDHASIIHMGGRIYDPDLGRFIQADPIVQDPRDAQSLNRYSYVYNNPLSYTDPTGYSTECGAKPGEVCPSAIEQQKAESAKAAQTQGSSKPEEVSKGNQSADLQNSAKKANGSTESELNTSDGWQYKGKTNGVDTYGKTYNRQDILNSIDDSGALHLVSEFSLPWDAATCLHHGCGLADSMWAIAAITPLGKYKKLDELTDAIKYGAKFDKLNLGEAVVNKKHHNWNKIFADKKPTLDDVQPIVMQALRDGQWQTTGQILGKNKKHLGDKIELVQEVNGQKIWVGGLRQADGTIIVNNAAVQ